MSPPDDELSPQKRSAARGFETPSTGSSHTKARLLARELAFASATPASLRRRAQSLQCADREHMTALFPAWTNTAYRIALVALAATPVLGVLGLMAYVRTPWNTEQYDVVDQPVEFDHRHHVVDDRIDCLYCHRGAEVSDYAGVPSAELCMGCHAQIYNESPLLEAVRRSYFSNKPIPWNRVHDVPDFAYFNHAVHVQGGVGCVNCHGRVDQMARVYKVEALHMGWCLDCHQHAERFTRLEALPTGALLEPALPYDVFWGTQPGFTPEPSLGPHELNLLTTCSACHR